MKTKSAIWATTALTTGLLAAGGAFAQSTGTQSLEEVVVTGARGPRNIEGAVVATDSTKSRNSVTQEYLATQTPGQTVLESLNLQPGVTFNNNDPYGSSGGDIVIRGFDSNRISLNVDGIQLNDTGNYAIYSNQQLDPELIERATVTPGSTDVDSPTASATGGSINYITLRPTNDFGGYIQPGVGSFGYKRLFGLVNTGEIGPWGTKAFFSASYTNYDVFNGPGELEKKQYNARIFQDLGGRDFASIAFHYNENRNNFIASTNVANFKSTGRVSTGNPRFPGTAFYGWSINPSNTGNIRGQFSKSLTETLRLTVDPTFQYVLANGGGTTNINERDPRLQGTAYDVAVGTGAAAPGVDLNGDGDVNDTVRLYSPNNTNTRRYSVNTSLIWDVADDHRLRLSYTWDRGRHRQTGEYGFLGADGHPEDVFGGKEGNGRQILTRDGDVFQRRNRSSVALLNRIGLEYIGNFFEDALTVNLGVAAPFFKRELNNFCYQQNTFDAYCGRLTAAEADFATPGVAPGAPRSFEREYEDVLPNVGATWRFSDNQQVYASYAENLSSPRTDDLYDRVPATPEPETSQTFDLGYRYQSGSFIASVAGFQSKFDNYIVRAFEELPGGETIAYSVNAGEIDRWGVDGQIGFEPIDNLSLSGSLSFIETEIGSNIPGETAGTVFQTRGRELPEVPKWQAGARAQYDFGPVQVGLQSKWVDVRWTNLTNTEKTNSYIVTDLDLRWDLGVIGYDDAFIQLNVTNLTDEVYLGNISTATSGGRTAQQGAPRAVSVSLRATF